MASTGTRTSSTTGSTEGITQTTTYLLAGDIGGTNSRLRLYASAHDQSDPLVDKDYRNQVALTDKNAGAFERLILHPFLEHCSTELKSKGLTPIDESEIIAVLACAGPVKKNEATLTNLGITIDGNAIESNLHCQHQGTHASTVKRALIINDFVAQGYGCLTLDSTEIMELTPGSLEMMDPTGPKVCVGAGTGLGECFLTPNGSGYTCFPSEGGHVEYNPRSSLEIDLRSFLMAETESDTRISVERVVSGTGLANVYRFLSTECPDLVDKVDKKIHDDFLSAGDQQGRVVSEGAKAGNEICAMAMDIMIRYVFVQIERKLRCVLS